MVNVAYIALGMIAGLVSGILGIGGGVIIVPALVLLFGLTQQHAQGTTLAILVLPTGLLAAYTYYKHGYVDIKIAIAICVGFFIGTLPGAKLATTALDSATLQKIYGGLLLLLGIRMIF